MSRPLWAAALLPATLVALLLPLAGRSPGQKKSGFDRAVTKVEAAFDPAEAKPGQTVALKVAVHLADGYYTYPLKQADKAAEGMVNTLKFPDAGPVVFVGEAIDPPEPKTKAEPEIGIKELRYYTGKVVFERKAVVSPAAKPGPAAVKLPAFKLAVCDATNCFPPKTLTPEAALKVLPGPGVPIDPKYAAEVKKAAGGP